MSTELDTRILKRCYQTLSSFESYFQSTGQDMIEFDGLVISYSELKKNLKEAWPELSRRQKEAFYWNVLQDYGQSKVAEVMGFTDGVTVQQYVEVGLRKILMHFEKK